MYLAGTRTPAGLEQAADTAEEIGADTPVATAKVRIPVTTTVTLTRQRLEAMLDTAVAGSETGSPVTVVRAPAGAGKTMLLATWARRRAAEGDVSVAWVSLDREDNDPALLWSAILRALQVSGAVERTGPLDGLTPPRGGSYAAFLAAVIAAFERLPRPVVLVLDGVHEVGSGNAIATLNLLLRHAPATVRVVLSARFPPPLILPRLKLEGRLREIGPDDLTFTMDEAGLLYSNQGIRLSETELGLLMERTEGWAAGLRLAAMSLADSARTADFVTEFTGDDRMVADYLLDEVVTRQPEEVERFMLSTCICRTFTQELAAALSKQENAGQILDRLERGGIVVVTWSQSTRWYRYHPLLRGYLRAELGRRRLTAQNQLHRTASRWFLDNGDPLRAIAHAIAAGGDDLVTRLIAKYGLEQIHKGESSRLRRLLDTVPPHVLDRPSVALVAAATALDLGDLSAADRRLRGINNAAHPLRTQRLRALHATVRLQRARMQGDLGSALATLETTRAGRTGVVDIDLLALVNRGAAHAWTGHHRAATADLQRAHQLATVERRDAVVLQCKAQLAAAAGAEGDLVQLGERAAAALDFAEARGWAMTSRSAYIHALQGLEAYQRLEDEQALKSASLATKLLARPADPTVELFVLTVDAMTSFDTANEPHEVAATLRGHWQRMGGKTLAPALVAYAAPMQQRMALRVGEYTWAYEVMERADALLVRSAERVLLRAMLHAHKGKVGAARRLLEPALSGRTRAISAPTLIDAWLLEAYLADRSGDGNRAHEALTQALGLAAPNQALRPFRDAGQSVRAMLAEGAGRFGRLEPFVAKVLTALPVKVPDPADGLTEREQALLAELPSMRTAEEIAHSLYVSVNTVKTHLRGIYRKLGVSQRRDAITVARQRGLL
ncbi:LuxR family transcriptional regulator, maltose regulon positive regulatory protein [Amycolatopsis xylanica]|uniref:LuxR family transcriptional regulator, maltose regulon positive regulatory protein n=1 Tax=Amycolatopsis xylanica TaxID=589385 RepID=A0A1H2VYM9_9PSEU|nr:LuxR C-terminal-related transcriptional regulator [Amycolatopsis xylanica]SDW73455.1 LuxR family transcriptional regulator, maltose regulon positive regulatory protein [Amycolatopsis xylanica]